MNSLHFAGDRASSQFPMKTTPKKIAKSIVGKSIGTPRGGPVGAAGCRIDGQRENSGKRSEQVLQVVCCRFGVTFSSLLGQSAKPGAPTAVPGLTAADALLPRNPGSDVGEF